MIDKVELLQDLIEQNYSKKVQLDENGILEICSCYNNNKINVNFIALIEIMYEQLDDETIDRILLTDEEL